MRVCWDLCVFACFCIQDWQKSYRFCFVSPISDALRTLCPDWAGLRCASKQQVSWLAVCALRSDLPLPTTECLQATLSDGPNWLRRTSLLRWLVFYFVGWSSLFKSSLNRAAEQTGPSQLELEPTDGVACRHSVVSSQSVALRSPVALTRSVDRQIRTESTESVTDWANRSEAIGFLSVLNTEAWWENTEISTYPQITSLTHSCLWVLWHFFKVTHKKLLIFAQKLPTAFSSKML